MTSTQNDIAELEKTALGLRRLALKIIFQAGSGHPGGSLSATDLMAALFFGGILRYDASQPKDPKRERPPKALLLKSPLEPLKPKLLIPPNHLASAIDPM